MADLLSLTPCHPIAMTNSPLRLLPFAVLILSLFSRANTAAETAAETAAASEQRLANTVKYLAADELEGRGPGTKGIDRAADYLADEFRKLGLKCDLFDGSPFQTFTIAIATELGPKEKNKLTFAGPATNSQPKQELTRALDQHFTPLALGGSAAFQAPLVFAGYGITVKEKDWSYDDYAGIDVKGKVVIVIRKEPQQEDEKSKFDGKKNTQHAFFQRKIANASEHGAAAVILVNDALELKQKREADAKTWAAAVDKLNELRQKFAEKPAPTAAEVEAHFKEATKLAEAAAEASNRLSRPADVLLPFNGAGEDGGNRKLPVLFCTRQAVDELLAASGNPDLATLENEIDSDLQPRSRELAGWLASGETSVHRKQAPVRNVIASLEGAGPLAEETIVVGAHYDHLGYGGTGSLAPWTKDIHNGADDNASGTATLVEIAHRLSQEKGNRRRIVFMAFTAEERGLLGSAHYTRNPRFALEKTVAMFNLDMVGRLKNEKLIVYGTGTAAEFEPLVNGLAEKMGFQLTKHPGGFGPSDHSSFYAKKIPVLHFFTGTHSDYHRPSDDTEKLEIGGMRRIADMVVETVRATDAYEQPPKYIEIKKVESIGGDPAAGDRPYFGSIPDYGSEEEGVALTGVQPDSPAAKAGLKAGDVIVQFGASRVTNIEDFMGALMKFKPGDKVKVGVKRGKERLDLDAVLEKRQQP